MKHVLLLLFFLCATAMTCSAPKHLMKPVELSEVVDAPGLTKDEIYVDINSWMVEFFASRESVVQFQDKESGKVVIKFSHYFGEDETKRNFVLDFETRDNVFRIMMKGVVGTYEYTDETSDYFTPEKNPYYRIYPDEVPLTDALFDQIIADVVDYMNNKETW